MKLTQALLPASKVLDGPDNEVTSNPDKYGGFEFGTWHTHLPWDGIPIKYNIRKMGECGLGVQCCHRFTPEECVAITTHLASFSSTGEGENAGKVDAHGRGHYIKWYNRLFELFGNASDPPVYYWAD